MTELGKTKQAIFETATTMFAQDGYKEVSMKQIAQAVGITPPSIYNHFTSKDAILTAIYDYVDRVFAEEKPNLNKLLELCETEHPHEVMRKTLFLFSKETRHMLSCALLVTMAMMRLDTRADEVINKNIIKMTYEYDSPLLRKMQALGRIEPMDIDAFVLLHSSFSFASAMRFFTHRIIETDKWFEAQDLLFKLVKPTTVV